MQVLRSPSEGQLARHSVGWPRARDCERSGCGEDRHAAGRLGGAGLHDQVAWAFPAAPAASARPPAARRRWSWQGGAYYYCSAARRRRRHSQGHGRAHAELRNVEINMGNHGAEAAQRCGSIGAGRAGQRGARSVPGKRKPVGERGDRAAPCVLVDGHRTRCRAKDLLCATTATSCRRRRSSSLDGRSNAASPAPQRKCAAERSAFPTPLPHPAVVFSHPAEHRLLSGRLPGYGTQGAEGPAGALEASSTVTSAAASARGLVVCWPSATAHEYTCRCSAMPSIAACPRMRC